MYFPISAAMFIMKFHRLTWTHFFNYILAIRFFLSQLISQLNIAFLEPCFRQLQIPNAKSTCYEILPAHTKTPRNTTHKIDALNLNATFRHCKKFRLLLNKGVQEYWSISWDVKIRQTKTRYSYFGWLDICNYKCVNRIKSSEKAYSNLCPTDKPTVVSKYSSSSLWYRYIWTKNLE